MFIITFWTTFVKKYPFKGHYEGQKFINDLKNQQMAPHMTCFGTLPKFSGHFSCGSAISLKVFRTYDHLVRSLQPCVIWLTAAQTGGQYLREDHTPKIGMKFSCQFIDERSVSTRRKSTNWGSETHFFFFRIFRPLKVSVASCSFLFLSSSSFFLPFLYFAYMLMIFCYLLS